MGLTEAMPFEKLDARLDRIERKLSALLKEKATVKETWVKANTIMNLTGWDGEHMRRARNNGLVKVKKNGSSIWYLVESISEIFIKKTA